jgi:hypothetical protein
MDDLDSRALDEVLLLRNSCDDVMLLVSRAVPLDSLDHCLIHVCMEKSPVSDSKSQPSTTKAQYYLRRTSDAVTRLPYNRSRFVLMYVKSPSESWVRSMVNAHASATELDTFLVTAQRPNLHTNTHLRT